MHHIFSNHRGWNVMSQVREELLSNIDSSIEAPSLSYWNSLLNFFRDHEDILDLHDMEILCTECERCRLYWNTDRIEIMHIRRAGGEVEQEKVIKGLGIEKGDVYPKIYEHLEILRAEEERRKAEELEELEREKEREVQPTFTPEADVIPLAAAAKSH